MSAFNYWKNQDSSDNLDQFRPPQSEDSSPHEFRSRRSATVSSTTPPKIYPSGNQEGNYRPLPSARGGRGRPLPSPTGPPSSRPPSTPPTRGGRPLPSPNNRGGPTRANTPPSSSNRNSLPPQRASSGGRGRPLPGTPQQGKSSQSVRGPRPGRNLPPNPQQDNITPNRPPSSRPPLNTSEQANGPTRAINNDSSPTRSAKRLSVRERLSMFESDPVNPVSQPPSRSLPQMPVAMDEPMSSIPSSTKPKKLPPKPPSKPKELSAPSIPESTISLEKSELPSTSIPTRTVPIPTPSSSSSISLDKDPIPPPRSPRDKRRTTPSGPPPALPYREPEEGTQPAQETPSSLNINQDGPRRNEGGIRSFFRRSIFGSAEDIQNQSSTSSIVVPDLPVFGMGPEQAKLGLEDQAAYLSSQLNAINDKIASLLQSRRTLERSDSPSPNEIQVIDSSIRHYNNQLEKVSNELQGVSVQLQNSVRKTVDTTNVVAGSPAISQQPSYKRLDGVKRQCVKAIRGHKGEHKLKLNYNLGDIIVVHEKFPTGWWKGELNNVIAYFQEKNTQAIDSPAISQSNVVEEEPEVVIEPFPILNTPIQNTPVQSTVTKTPISIEKVSTPPIRAQPAKPTPQPPSKPARKQAVALYPYSKNNNTELDIYEGEVVEVIKDMGSWTYVKGNSGKGYVPTSYIQMQ